MLNNIIFDWSGVIKDCVLDQLVIVNKIFKQFGAKEITIEEFQENWSQPYMVFYNKYLPNLTIEEETVAYKKAIAESPKAKEYAGISDLIKRAKKRNKKIVVVSSDYPKTILPEIESFGLEGVFDDIVVDAHDKEEEVRDLIKRNSFNEKDTVFIGDSNHEIEVGKKLGIKTIAVTWGFSLENKLKNESPDFIVHNLKELEEIILAEPII